MFFLLWVCVSIVVISTNICLIWICYSKKCCLIKLNQKGDSSTSQAGSPSCWKKRMISNIHWFIIISKYGQVYGSKCRQTPQRNRSPKKCLLHTHAAKSAANLMACIIWSCLYGWERGHIIWAAHGLQGLATWIGHSRFKGHTFEQTIQVL